MASLLSATEASLFGGQGQGGGGGGAAGPYPGPRPVLGPASSALGRGLEQASRTGAVEVAAALRFV